MFGACSNRRECTEQEKVTAEWNAMAGEWDDVALGYAQGLYDLLVRENENIHQAKCIVDFGCGTGLLTEQILMRRKKSWSQPPPSDHDVDHHELRILAIDPSTEMMDLLQDKILSRDWTTIVHPVCVALGQLDHDDDDDDAKNEATTHQQVLLEKWYGHVDLIVASNVLNYIPEKDLLATLQQLNRLLAPGGCLVHSDWPPHQYQQPEPPPKQQPSATEAVTSSSSNGNTSTHSTNLPRYPNGIMTEQRARELYAMVGWQPELMQIRPLKMGNSKYDDTAMIFLGIARKSV